MNRFWTLFIRGISGHKMMSFASVCIVSASMILLGIFIAVGLNVNLLTDKIGDNSEIIAYISNSELNLSIEEIESELCAVEGVKEVIYRSKEDRMNMVAEQIYGDDAYVFASGQNILRDSFVIKLLSAVNSDFVTKQAESIAGVEEVVCNSDVLKSINTIVDYIKNIGIWVALIMLLMALFILFNTIKLCISSQSDEILLMKTIGATANFICVPYIMQGVFLALTGALLASFAVIAFYAAVYAEISPVVSSGLVDIIHPGTMSLIIIPIFAVISLVIGIFGSVISVKKYLRERMV